MSRIAGGAATIPSAGGVNAPYCANNFTDRFSTEHDCRCKRGLIFALNIIKSARHTTQHPNSSLFTLLNKKDVIHGTGSTY
ncbi:MAG: hypothetical protein ACRDDA_01570 [Aeromonas sp.]